MATVATFIRSTPVSALRTYFDAAGVSLPETVDWTLPDSEVVRPILQAVDRMTDGQRARVVNDAERVSEMADEAGQTALYSVTANCDLLDTLTSGSDRALWMFVNEQSAFRQAEDVRFTDDRRRGRMWDGFVGVANIVMRRDQAAIDAFKAAVRERFNSGNVHVDIFNRYRPTFGGEDCELVQVTVYREGLPEDFKEFVNDQLDRRSRRPVFEAALTYEPATGVIEVVANDRESRQDLVRLFSRDLLASEFSQEKLPLRQFDLEELLKPHVFPTDPEDGIEAVRVNHLRLMPLDAQGERVTIECMRQSSATIWAMAEQRFGAVNPLLGGWIITQAKLTIRFHPDSGSRRGRTLPLTITMPHGCDLKDRTERERLIGEKYLRRWGLVADV